MTVHVPKPIGVLLLSNQPGLATSVLYCLRGMNAKIVAVGNQRMRFLRWSRFCKTFINIDFLNAEPAALTTAIDTLVSEHGLDIVLAGDHDAQLALTRVRNKVAAPCFPMPTEKVFATVNDKWSFRNLCEELDVPTPRTVLMADKSELDIDRLEAAFGFPLVVKPTNEGDGDGVVIAENRADLLKRVVDNPDYRFRPLIAQEYIPGEDLDLSILAVDGEVIASAVQSKMRDEVVFREHADLVDAGLRLAKATGFSGVAHFDARLDGATGRLALIECNARFWASIAHAHWCGVNFVELGVKHALGRSLVDMQRPEGKSVRTPERLLARLTRLKTLPWRLSASERLSLTDGVTDPALMLMRPRNMQSLRRLFRRTRL